jgi:hypothetical protein
MAQKKNKRREAAFVFHAPLTSKRPTKADRKRGARVCEFNTAQKKAKYETKPEQGDAKYERNRSSGQQLGDRLQKQPACQNPGGSQEFQTGDDRQGGGAWEKDT